MSVITNPQRLEIQKRLAALLRTITPANGYAVDFSGAEGTKNNRVFRGRAVFGSTDPVPMLSILESPIPLDQLAPPTDATMSNGGWELVVQGFVEDDKENPTDPAHVALADVRKILALEKQKASAYEPEDMILGIGNLVTGITIGSGVVRPPDEVSAKAYFWLLITLDLAEDLAEPYTT